MVFWVFGYGSLVWNPGFDYDEKIIGFIKDYRRVFDLGKSRAGETILAQLPQFLRHGILNYFCSVHWSPGNAWKPSENLHIGGERRGYLRKCIVMPLQYFNSYLLICFLIISSIILQWGAAYCVRGGPEKEKLAMQVKLFSPYRYQANYKCNL